MVFLLLAISAICYFIAISLGYCDIPFTEIWKQKRELEIRKEKLELQIRRREYIYYNCLPYYQILASRIFQVVNSLHASSSIARVRDIRTLLVPQDSGSIMCVNGKFDFYFYIKLQLPNTQIRNGELVSEQANYEAAERELSTHLPQFLDGTGFSFERLTVYQDNQGNYRLRVSDVRYIPPVPGNQVYGLR